MAGVKRRAYENREFKERAPDAPSDAERAVAAARKFYEVPEAGAQVGLSRNASYEAVKRGDIPVMRFGRLLRVPAAAWDRIVREGHLPASAAKPRAA